MDEMVTCVARFMSEYMDWEGGMPQITLTETPPHVMHHVVPLCIAVHCYPVALFTQTLPEVKALADVGSLQDAASRAARFEKARRAVKLGMEIEDMHMRPKSHDEDVDKYEQARAQQSTYIMIERYVSFGTALLHHALGSACLRSRDGVADDSVELLHPDGD